MSSAFSGDETEPFFGFLDAAAALVFSCMGAGYGTTKSGVGVVSKASLVINFVVSTQERINNPISGCSVLITSLQRQIEALQSRVTALEVRFGGGSSGANAIVNPSLSLAHIGSSSRLLSSADNTAPEFVPTAVNLPQSGAFPISGDRLGYPCSDSLLRLLMSTENVAPNTLPTTTNPSEHRAFPTYPNMSNYQARLEGFSGGSSQVGSVTEVAESSNPNRIVLGYNSFDYPSSDLSAILNFGTDDHCAPRCKKVQFGFLAFSYVVEPTKYVVIKQTTRLLAAT
ncbi:hypothetical protein LguiA_029993 [Lonicera macranthoides]